MCDCIELLNKVYAEKGINTVVSQAFDWTGTIPNAMVVVEKRNPRMHGKAIRIFAAYCPFCGKQYDNFQNEHSLLVTEGKVVDNVRPPAPPPADGSSEIVATMRIIGEMQPNSLSPAMIAAATIAASKTR
jgi:hypothetical protein